MEQSFRNAMSEIRRYMIFTCSELYRRWCGTMMLQLICFFLWIEFFIEVNPCHKWWDLSSNWGPKWWNYVMFHHFNRLFFSEVKKLLSLLRCSYYQGDSWKFSQNFVSLWTRQLHFISFTVNIASGQRSFPVSISVVFSMCVGPLIIGWWWYRGEYSISAQIFDPFCRLPPAISLKNYFFYL